MATAPLQDLLDTVLNRLAALEASAGITPPAASSASKEAGASEDAAPQVAAYDAYMEKAVLPLAATCDKIGTLENLGTLVKDAWGSIRDIVLLASRSKKPGNVPMDLQPHLKPTQTALEAIRKLRLDRKYDWHIKSIIEMAACLSWILIAPPPQTPAAFCKEAIASSTFWSNKIRKEYKGKDETQIAFCDGLKALGNDLVDYVTNHHKTGLAWNPRGVALADAAKAVESAPKKQDAPKPAPKPVSRGGGGGVSGLMAELAKKKTSDGASAATGLRKVRRN